MKSGNGTRGDLPQSPERCSTAPHYEQWQSMQRSLVKDDRGWKRQQVQCVDSLGGGNQWVM